MGSPLRQYRAEIQAHLNATNLDRSLQRRHLAAVALGMVSCLGLLVVNLNLVEQDLASWRIHLGISIGFTYICMCLVVSLDEQTKAFHRLRVPTADVAERAKLLVDHLFRRDAFLLTLALLGHGVAWFDTLLGIRLWSTHVLIVLLPLVPTMQLVWIGLDEVPTRGRLVFLYKLVALYSERAR